MKIASLNREIGTMIPRNDFLARALKQTTINEERAVKLITTTKERTVKLMEVYKTKISGWSAELEFHDDCKSRALLNLYADCPADYLKDSTCYSILCQIKCF